MPAVLWQLLTNVAFARFIHEEALKRTHMCILLNIGAYNGFLIHVSSKLKVRKIVLDQNYDTEYPWKRIVFEAYMKVFYACQNKADLFLVSYYHH